MTEKIIAAAKDFLGGECSREAALAAMSAAAELELLARLNEDVEVADIEGIFVTAAAVLALSMYIRLDGSEDWSSFTAGNVSVTRTGASAGENSALLRQQAVMMLRPYLYDDGFAFRGVRG